MAPVSIIGAGPAGASAAIAACSIGASVDLYEKSVFPRHKVCGEFLSPEVAAILHRLGAWESCQELSPARISSVHLSIGRAAKSWKLREPAHGLSRFALDRILLDAALQSGAVLHRETRKTSPAPLVIAHGRHARTSRGMRLFGFKAHFLGLADDVMNLFFFDDCYVGVNAVEAGQTNVCGLAPEDLLRRMSFDIDALLHRSRALRERTEPLTRAMDWLITGPLLFGISPQARAEPGVYFAGDALGFVDPFTGSGMLSAISTGSAAGFAAAKGLPPDRYRAEYRKVLASQYRAAAFFRSAIRSGLAEWLLPLLPGPMLFHITRPNVN